MSVTPNGTHNGTTPQPAYTQEDIDRLTDLGVVLTWEDLDAEDRLACCLANPDVDEWLEAKALETFADFRTIPTQWAKIKAGYRRLGGDVWLLEEAVQAVLDARPGALPATGTPLVIDMDTVTTRPIEWLWYPYLAIGKLCILDGDPGVGKTLFATQLAANVSRGHPMPDQDGKPTLATGAPGLVVFIATEDDLEDTVKPRLEQAGADCTKVKVFNEWQDGAGKIHIPSDLVVA